MIEDHIRLPPDTDSEHYDVEADNDLYIFFVDFKKAYDTVPRRILYCVLESKYGIPSNIVEIIRNMYEGLRLHPIARQHIHENGFTPKVGVQKGGVMSPVLWNMFLHHMLVQ